MGLWTSIRGLFGKADPEAAYQQAKQDSKEPWAAFEITGFEDSGRVKVGFSWNQAFIDKIKSLGFDAETDEDRVQLFFFASSMRPMSLSAADDSAVQSSEHPQLSSVTNEIRV